MPNWSTEKKSYKDIGATCSDLEAIINNGASAIIAEIKREITEPFREALCDKIELLEEVEGERDDLKTKVEELEAELDDVKDQLKTSEAENEELRARIAELENGE